MLTEFFIKNLDIVFFIYGLAFFIMGVAIFVQPRRESEFRLAGILWLLAFFGLTHGMNEFLDMWSIIKGRNQVLDIVRWFMLISSYIFLFEFGRRLFLLTALQGYAWTRKVAKLFSGWLPAIIVSIVFTFGFISFDFWKIGSIWARYLLGFPGSFLSGLGFLTCYKYEKKVLEPLRVKGYFYWAALAFLTYAILGGLVVPKANFFPASWLSNDSFVLVVKFPVQAFRAICAIISTVAIRGILIIFNWEMSSRLKQAQAQLIQSAKMASLGQLAAGAAHEINNPLFVISGEAEMLLKDANKDRDTKEASKNILEHTGRIKRIIDMLLGFSRQRGSKFQVLEVNKVAEESLSLLSYQVNPEGVKIINDLASGLPKILADRDQLQEVFLNIMLNAVQAMEGAGTLTIKTYSQEITGQEARKTDKFKPGDKIVVIEIRDTGKGMDGETLNKIFDPFFTTKEKGAGLGLSISYGIIQNHAGEIEAYSKLGEGSTFLVKLPVHRKEAER